MGLVSLSRPLFC